jgi:hypothetical protein
MTKAGGQRNGVGRSCQRQQADISPLSAAGGKLRRRKSKAEDQEGAEGARGISESTQSLPFSPLLTRCPYRRCARTHARRGDRPGQPACGACRTVNLRTIYMGRKQQRQ